MEDWIGFVIVVLVLVIIYRYITRRRGTSECKNSVHVPADVVEKLNAVPSCADIMSNMTEVETPMQRDEVNKKSYEQANSTAQRLGAPDARWLSVPQVQVDHNELVEDDKYDEKFGGDIEDPMWGTPCENIPISTTVSVMNNTSFGRESLK